MTDPSAPLIPLDVRSLWNGEGEGRSEEEEERARNSPKWGQTPLDMALHEGHNEITQMLVQIGGKCLQVCARKVMNDENSHSVGAS